MKSSVAIIPARGGSKGIPGKNIRLVGGKPLIAYTIEAARQTRSIQRVIVSTDSPEIGEVSTRLGAEVVWRPADISGDTASSESALLHVLQQLQQAEQRVPELLVFLQCTSPLTTAADIDGTIQALHEENADTALAVTPFHYFLWRRDQGGEAVGINHDKFVRPLRQEREQQFLETGAVYVMRTDGFLEAKHRFFGKTALYVTPPERCLEIDEPSDLEVAEERLRQRHRQQCSKVLPQQIGAIVLDFDGVFTDNRVVVFEDGREAVLCHRGDGLGLEQLKKLGIPILVLSTEKNPVVQARCAKLGLICRQGCDDKLGALREWLAEVKADPQSTIYIGNDINDLACLKSVGCPTIVADAHPAIRPAARLTLTAPGGCGAIRELCDLIQNSVTNYDKSIV